MNAQRPHGLTPSRRALARVVVEIERRAAARGGGGGEGEDTAGLQAQRIIWVGGVGV